MRILRNLALLLALLNACHGASKEHVTLIANVPKGPQTSDAVDLSFASEKLQEEQQELQGLLNWAISKQPRPSGVLVKPPHHLQFWMATQ